MMVHAAWNTGTEVEIRFWKGLFCGFTVSGKLLADPTFRWDVAARLNRKL
jgi:hypothetical protein